MALSEHNRDDALLPSMRRRLFDLMADLGRPAETQELAERVGLHPNGARWHLDRMLEAGLVVRSRVRQPRGRPRDQWSIAADAEPRGAAPPAYRELAGWLARAIPARPDRLREVERTGRAIGRQLARAEAASPEAGMREVLARLGFQPHLERDASGRLDCRLQNCPYRDAVRENREVVCTLHRGLTAGMLDAIEPRASLVKFVPHDPATAGCEIEIVGLP